MKPRHFIYGIFSPDGLCHYIGQTTDLASRERSHRNANTSRLVPLLPWKMRKLATANDRAEAATLETEWIGKMRANGEAKENRASKATAAVVSEYATHTCLETGELFYGFIAIAQHLKAPHSTLRHWFRKNSIDGVIRWHDGLSYRDNLAAWRIENAQKAQIGVDAISVA